MPSPTPPSVPSAKSRYPDADMRRTIAGLVLLMGLGLGCRPNRATTSPSADSEDSARKAAASLARIGLPAGGGTSIDAKYDALFDSPALSAAGERFLDRVGAAPELAPQFEAFLAALVGDARFLAAAGGLLAQDPTGGIEAIASRLEQGIDDPTVEAALDTSLDTLFDSKAVDDAAGRLATTLLEHSDLVPRMTQLLLAWQPDLEAALGVPMHHADFEARWQAHLAQDDRSGQVERLVLDHLVAEGSVPQAIVALVESDGFLQVAVDRLTALLGDPAFVNAGIDVFVAIIAGKDPEATAAKIEALVLGPAVSSTAVKWLDDIAALPETAAIGGALGAILDDPELVAQLHAIVVGVPARRTAQAHRLRPGAGSGSAS